MKSSLIILVALTIIVVTFWLTEGPPETALAAELDLVRTILFLGDQEMPFFSTASGAYDDKGHSLEFRIPSREEQAAVDISGVLVSGFELLEGDLLGFGEVQQEDGSFVYFGDVLRMGSNGFNFAVPSNEMFPAGGCITLRVFGVDRLDELPYVELSSDDGVQTTGIIPETNDVVVNPFVPGGQFGASLTVWGLYTKVAFTLDTPPLFYKLGA